jgi:hypothetical protein
VPVGFAYRRPFRAVHLLVAPHAAAATRNAGDEVSTGDSYGVGDVAWLITTPFLTAELVDEAGDARTVLVGIADDADTDKCTARLLERVVAGDGMVALSESSAEFVAAQMRIPLAILLDDGAMVALRRGQPPK